MANQYFQFKQFTVQQAHCAMKVCTDACLFGAWLAAHLQEAPIKGKLLDIGTGTGLLSLMVAQQHPLKISAVEIETAAAQQATENFDASAFSSQLQVINADINQWQNNQPFEFIFSNPPFFDNDLKSIDPKKNIALHSAALSIEQLIHFISYNISKTGTFALLLPYHRKNSVEQLATQKGFHLWKSVSVKQTPKHPFFRSFLLFGSTAKTPLFDEIIIQNNGVYTERFNALLKPYYLAL